MEFLHEWIVNAEYFAVGFVWFAVFGGIYAVGFWRIIKIQEEPFIALCIYSAVYWSVVGGLTVTIVRAL